MKEAFIMKSKGYRPKKEFTMKQKLTGTALCLLMYRLLSFVPLPFANREYIRQAVGANGSLGLLNTHVWRKSRKACP